MESHTYPSPRNSCICRIVYADLPGQRLRPEQPISPGRALPRRNLRLHRRIDSPIIPKYCNTTSTIIYRLERTPLKGRTREVRYARFPRFDCCRRHRTTSENTLAFKDIQTLACAHSRTRIFMRFANYRMRRRIRGGLGVVASPLRSPNSSWCQSILKCPRSPIFRANGEFYVRRL